MEKTLIRPEQSNASIKRVKNKVDQPELESQIKKNIKDNEGCPLLPIHKLDKIYQNRMQDYLKEPIKRPKERNWQ